ncbi:HAD family hydrolase [Nonomuraea endophytica]|uniref:Putative hydrolase of the HAD superfamily n=1 Tax=Nonomuraea endophytica TaxID=714136 RepID=A0A7W8A8V0_9ACTN|nr:HAD family hydrolase [Nonomuraea endophytica]MBB5081705.1 putative hydrolase of the HAD superfamily [Nonomuraea endophytica]
MIKGILFDLDGTLMDHRAAADAGIAAWIADHSPGLPLPERAARVWAELEDVHLSAWHAGECDLLEQRRRRIRGICQALRLAVPDDIDAAFAAFTRHYRAGWSAYPDAHAALAHLGGYRLGVLTNGSSPVQIAKMGAIGLGELGPVLSGDVLDGHFKPAPASYLAAAERLGLEPGAILLVGDDLVNDVTGPAAAGMRSLWLDRLGVETAPEGFARITTLSELPGYLSGHSDLG